MANLADFYYKELIEIGVNLAFSVSLICGGYLLVNSQKSNFYIDNRLLHAAIEMAT